ncbi:phosphoribosylglycinamide formyltransferase [Sphingomonas sp. ASV193]|uniref:phosphoribosylglycinamide formyltransferase n=1 Tax=Sphingomonas sp. ASV193 TaxID=3144405 RepID=UPI0032E84E3E
MDRARVAVLISGRGSNMAALLYAAKADDCPFAICAVLSDKPQAAGLALAAAEGVPTAAIDAKALKAGLWPALEAAIAEANPDYIALAGFMRIIPAGFVERWAGRLVNIHPSLLPKYKGLHTHQSAIDAGDDVTGATVHLVTPEVDSGAILGQVEVAILPGDDAEALDARVLIAEHQLYPRVLAEFVRRAERKQ